MKKILFLVNHDVVIYNFRLEMVERFLKDGHEVHVASPNGERIADLIKLGCVYHEYDLDRHGMNPIKEYRILRYYKKLMKQVAPDIILGFTIKPNIYGAFAAKKYNIPFVANITGLGTAVENESFSQKIIVMLYKHAFKRVQRIFFQNKENLEFFKSKKIATDDKYILLPGSGVNLQRFQPLEYPQTESVEFVFISRIMKEKGIEQYLDAAECITAKYPGTKFHICGFCEKEYEGRLDECVRKGIVIYHGMIRDVREVLRITHCTIHPTFYPEGLSNVLLESCACARPIITTKRSGCREVVEEGKNGYLINERDSKDLIRQIERFLTLSGEEKSAMGLYGRAKVEKEFDRQIVVGYYVNEL